MIYTYQKALEKYKSNFRVKKALKESNLLKLERGIYTSSKEFSNFSYVVRNILK